MTHSLSKAVSRGLSLLSSSRHSVHGHFPVAAAAVTTKLAERTSVYRHFSLNPAVRQSDSSSITALDLNSAAYDARIRQLSAEALEESLKHDDYFGLQGLVKIQELFDAGVHYGHKQGMGYEAMAEYLLGHRFETCVIDLNHTAPLLEDALNIIAHIAFRGGIILFVSNHRETAHLVETTAMGCGEYAHTKEWLTKVLCDSTKYFGAVTRLPDLVIILSTKTTVFADHLAVRDAAKMLIPSVAICDSNSDPRLVTYPIPGNDDSVSAVSLYLRLFKTAIIRGKTKRASVLVREERGETVDGILGEGMASSSSSTTSSTKEKNEELIRQITALQEATKRSNERMELEREAQAREAEFVSEERQEKEAHAKKIRDKKKAGKKKMKRIE